MTYKLATIIKPTLEPVSLLEAKSNTNGVDFNDDDHLFLGWIIAAREECESYMSRAYITQTLEVTLDGWPKSPCELPRAPLISVASIKYFDTDDVEAEFSSSNYFVGTGTPGRISLNFAQIWPTTTLRPIENVKIRFVVGYGTNVTDIPETVRNAIMLYCTHKYENKEGEDEFPKEFYDLLRPDRLYI